MNSVCESTGHNPAYLTFGRELRHPFDVSNDFRQIIQNENFLLEFVLRNVRDVHENRKDQRKKYFDSHRRVVNFEIGDSVLALGIANKPDIFL